MDFIISCCGPHLKTSRMLTSGFVRLERLLWPASLKKQVKHVGGLDASEEEPHRSVFLAFVRSLQILVKFIVLYQATALQRNDSVQLHQLR